MHADDALNMRLYLRFGTEVRGPMRLGDIRRLHDARQLDSNCHVSADRKRWMPVASVLNPTSSPSVRNSSRRASNPDDHASSTVLLGTGARAVAAPTVIRVKPLWVFDTPRSQVRWVTPAVLFWVAALIVFPLGLSWAKEALGLPMTQTVWLASGYYCLLFAWLLRLVLQVDAPRWKSGLLYAVFTAFIGVIVLQIWHSLPAVQPFDRLTESTSWSGRFSGHLVAAGLLEEACKLLPLIFLGMRRGGITRPAEGLWLGIMSGLGFAWAEGVIYTSRYWSGSVMNVLNIAQGANTSSVTSELMEQMMEQGWSTFMTQQVRFLTLPLMHGAWAAMTGLCAAHAYLSGRWWFLFAGWVAAAAMHGLYNSLSGGLGGVGVAACTMIVLVVLADRSRNFASEGDSAQMVCGA